MRNEDPALPAKPPLPTSQCGGKPRQQQHPPPSQIFNAYASKKAIDVKQIKFVFDGQRLSETDTPESMGMEDGDNIDAFLEQVGGASSGTRL